MRHISRTFRNIARVTLLAFCATSLYAPVAQAGMISTQAIVHKTQVDQQRARIKALLERQDVRLQLVAMGVDPAVVKTRVNGLTDQEVARLSKKMNQMPAGGDGFIGALVFVFLVLLITDILGFTHVFPFVKHPQK